MNAAINNGRNGFSSTSINNMDNYLSDQSCLSGFSGPAPSPDSSDNGGDEFPFNPSDDICFSDRMTANVLGKGATRMDQLKAGDWVWTSQGYSKIYSFGHYDPVRKAEFLQLQTSPSIDAPLEISADHMLYVYNQEDRTTRLLPARSVKLNDILVTEQGTSVEVWSVAKIQRRGIYAPFTVSGDIAVNGIVASNYIALPPAFQKRISFDQQHWIQHGAYAPYRIYCLAVGCDQEARDEVTGFSIGTTMGLPLLRWLENHSQVILPVFLYVVAIPGYLALLLVEQTVLNVGQLTAVLLGYWIWKKQNNNRKSRSEKREGDLKKPSAHA